MRRCLEKNLEVVLREGKTLELREDSKLIIFSDIHIGDKTEGSDDFKGNCELYRCALEEYYREGFSLILLGDCEELWECDLSRTIIAYSDIFALYAKFINKKRLFRVVGNHDITLTCKHYLEREEEKLRRSGKESLIKFIPGITGYPFGIKLKYGENTIVLIHGHQGDFKSNQLWKLSKPAVKYFWKGFQMLFKVASESPAKKLKKRAKYERDYYDWARRHKVILIAGHTHRPAFASKTKIDRLMEEERRLMRSLERERDEKKEKKLQEIRRKIERKIREEGESAYLGDLPLYFNPGCCIFPDSVITGIEITGDEIRLVGFKLKGCKISKIIYEKGSLKKYFKRIA